MLCTQHGSWFFKKGEPLDVHNNTKHIGLGQVGPSHYTFTMILAMILNNMR